ncbi:manganese-dependent inorganic pyrophosphatase [Caldibacillus debilis]|jgi:manganese-dependent inorganic pyrophosphatase|uniref:Probable manganese-dependent inorganic pyrophosphatase n=1 Tax=Caldibacillus debilis GB1 TaxID=1339248 RepID=A0A420VGG6_9BACI|nr:manganese-dependent inorganic pyrophosphatase [Caldibacillus debilis]RKO62697.1 Inorganic pyrophosphatase/exopolyphosphatase [Caldibacillus debilis GB1]
MEKVLIFGHKNPDTDSICSAIAYAALKRELGMNAEAVRLGEVNGETQYALDYFRMDAPRLVKRVTDETKTVILVDHNERQQSVDDIAEAKILEVIDHHRIANFETADPLYYRAEPVGCTATILKKLFKEHNIPIKKEIAGLLVSAIISDSLLFKSPTCTEEDVQAARELAEIAGIDLESYGMAMLKAGANVGGKSAEELISLDAKEFHMGGYHVEIAQVNTVDPNEVLAKKAELEKAIESVIKRKGLDLFLFVITDILNSDSIGIALGKEQKAAGEAFAAEVENNTLFMKGVVSRKKQVVPVLTNAFEKRKKS